MAFIDKCLVKILVLPPAPLLWPPDVKSLLIGKDCDAGKDLRAGEEGGDRRWDGWMASLTQRTWVCANSGRQWRTGKPGVPQSMWSQSQTWLSDWTAGTAGSWWVKDVLQTPLVFPSVALSFWFYFLCQNSSEGKDYPWTPFLINSQKPFWRSWVPGN